LIINTIILSQQPSIIYWVTLLIILILIIILAYFYLEWKTWSLFKEEKYLEKIIQKRTDFLKTEIDKVEHLLSNVLPKETADELKNTGKVRSQKYELISVLFSDIQGFTKIAKEMEAEELINQLDTIFYNFDLIVEKFHIEKIKTIGDAYMCAGGIPYKNRTNPVEVVLAALEMQQSMKDFSLKSPVNWQIRIGIHTGPAIAGVVGRKRLSFDIWGDTVNTAKRLEATGAPGKINISGHTYEYIKDFFDCEYRGKLPVKNIGAVEMFFVKEIKPELYDSVMNVPNKVFINKLQLLRLKDLEFEITTKIKEELPINLYFNNIEHTLEAYKLVEILGMEENVSNEDLLLLRTAVLLHDIGFIWIYEDHEIVSSEYAKKILITYHYTPEQIDRISKLIISTQTQKTKDLLEKIMNDALNAYMRKKNYIEKLEKLFLQMKEKNKISNEKSWYMDQIKYFSTFEFYTNAANKFKEIQPEDENEIILSIKSKLNVI